MKHKLESRLPGEISITSDDTTLMSESEEELKSFLMKVKEESENAGLKLNIQTTKIMASSPITSWQIDGETVADFILGGIKITTDGDCSHEIKMLAPWKESYDHLDSILKSRDITLPIKVYLVKAMIFPETAAHQAPLSLGFSRQEYWSGLPFRSPMHESEK